MVAGLILGRERVRSMVSIGGPTQPGWYGEEKFVKGFDPRLFCAPTELVGREAPPLLAVHSLNDDLVRPEESISMVERMRQVDLHAEIYLYDGPGKQHGIWRDERTPPRLFQHIEDVIADFLHRTL
ncbi:MAG: alpha/beta hydrolase family protein [bacterium]